MAELNKGQLASENNNSFPNNNAGLITPTALRTFNGNMIDSLVDEVSYNIDSASFSSSIAQLQGFSSSLDATFATDAQLTSLSASVAVTDLAQSQSIAQLLGFSSSLDATYATDAQLTALSTSVAVTDNGQDSKLTSLINATSSYVTESETSSFARTNQSNIFSGNQYFLNDVYVDSNRVLFTNRIQDNAGGIIYFYGDLTAYNPASHTVNANLIGTASFATTASFALNAGASVDTGSLVTTSSFNAFTQSYLNDSASVDSRLDSLETAGYVTNSITASSLVTASFSSQTLTFTKGDGSQFSLAIPDVSGSTIDTGSFATTGSNTFVGNQVVSSSIIGVGDLYIQPTNQSTNFSNVSASVSGNIIFGAIFGDNQIQQTGSFVVSGSNNVVLVGKPTATSGYYSYVNGALNVVGAAVRLSTSSLLRPTMYNNIIQRGVTLNFTTSSFASAPNFGNNLLYGAGTTNINHQSGSINFQSNLVGGGNIFTSTQNVTPTNTRAGITSNIFNGTQTFLHQSSSITLDRNIFNGLTAPAIRNDFSNSFNDGLTVSRNVVNGNGVFIYNSGSTTAGTAQGNRSITDNLFGGVNIIVSSSHIATNNTNTNLVGAIVHGYNLNVSASSTTSTGGNVFVGRNNDTSSNLASTSDIIFAVGTGTSTSARKTGLWIDTASLTTINGGLYVTQSQVTLTNSGSTPGTLALAVRSGSVEVTSPQGNGYFYTNLPITSSNLRINGDGIISDLFVSGVFAGNSTLNVAGNSYFTGSVNVNNSANITGSLYIQNGSGDFYIYGHKMFNSAEFWSTTTQSGSAGVSGSITFNNSGSVNGVSLANNSQLTVANAGTYNIQFSAQIETSAGADTAYLWFKKNGTNISDSATKVVLANNTAQVMTVNILDEAAANDYYELGYQFTNGNATILSEAASGNIPAIPSVIATITQAR